jgi:hypothetical protein
VLKLLLTAPLKFTRIMEERRRGYASNGTIALDRLLAGVVDLPTKMNDRRTSSGWPSGRA